jgi:hypothetical protein
MRGRKCGEIAGSSRGMYIRNIEDIPELYDISCYLKKIILIKINILKEIEKIKECIQKGRYFNV